MATGVNTFPLLDAAVSTPKMFVSSPLAYIENQGSDLLAAISELSDVPNMAGDLQKVLFSRLITLVDTLLIFSATCFTTYARDSPAAYIYRSPILIKSTLPCLT